MKFASKEIKGSLGTFAGVFTPSVLTILGIILFLRLGYVVGNAGLARALIIIALANAISFLTSISLSAIATNLKVKGGGDYYLISRTLGVEFGGAIGIVLFLAQSVSIAFYTIGFGEAMTGILPSNGTLSPRLIAAFAVSFLFIFAWLGADWATRFQYVVMAFLGAAIFSFSVGGMGRWDYSTLTHNWAAPAGAPPFWGLFAIFFPAVTGFTQGVSMSGDLRDPGKSLPLGTFCAVGISIFVYFGAAIVLAGALPNPVLATEYSAMKQVSSFGLLIDAGVIAATLSSAMASFLGAPRILQSLAGDRIFPFLLPFAKGAGATNNPRRGVLLSTIIAFVTIALGNLNVIAPVVSMFFLISYGLLNYATFYEARSASPSFRPTFRFFDHRLSLLGFFGCLGAMLAIDLPAGLIAIAVLFAIFQYLKRTAGPARWADSQRSYHLQQVREHLLAAAAEPEHPRDWRPQVLAITGDTERQIPLLRFASWIQGRSGSTTAVRIIEGEGLKMVRMREAEMEALRAQILKHGLSAFPLVVSAPSFRTGVETLIQSFGIGPVKANILIVNWFENDVKGIFGPHEFISGAYLQMAFRLGSNVILLDIKESRYEELVADQPQARHIDIWWADDKTSHLMLLLAHLMRRDDVWEGSSIRVFAMGHDRTLEGLQKNLEETRIEAEPNIVPDVNPDSIIAHSRETSVVFLPFRLVSNELKGPFGFKLEALLPELPITALVMAAEDIDLDAEPEEGKPGEMAGVADAAQAAQERAREAEKEASKTLAAAQKAEKRLDDMISSAKPGVDRKDMEEIERAVAEADTATAEAEKASRRLAKAQAKAKDAVREAEALGIEKPHDDNGDKGSDSGEAEP